MQETENWIVVRIDPIPKPRMTQADRWKKRPVVLRYFAWCDQFRLACQDAGVELDEELKATFVIEMPASWSKKKRAAMIGTPHRQKPDLDNIVKAVNDGLLHEDKAIHSIQVNKIWGETGKIIFR